MIKKQRKKPPKIPKKRICIQYTICNYDYLRGLRGLPLTRGKNVYILRILPTLKGLQFTEEKELSHGKTRVIVIQKVTVCDTVVSNQ